MEKIPPEVLVDILGILDTRDLLNFRLVNQGWNQAFSNTIHSHGSPIVQRLNTTTIPKYIKFIKKHRSGSSLFPIYLDIQTTSNLPCQTAKLTSREYGGLLLTNVLKLIKHFGRDCIQGLSFCKIDGQTNFDTFRDLNFISARSVKEIQVEISWPIPQDSLEQISYSSFPNLKKVTFKTWTPSGQALLDILLASSPNLDTLELTSMEYFDISSIHLPKLKSLLVHCLNAALRFPSNILMNRLTFPLQLKTLEIFYPKIGVLDNKITQYINCLDKVSNTLNSLTIIMYPPRGQSAFYLPFPILPMLEHLAFKLAATTDKVIFLNPRMFNFDVSRFPVLKSLELHLGVYLTTEFMFLDMSVSNFPKGVTDLTIHVDFEGEKRVMCGIESRRCRLWMCLRNYLQYLYCIFPKVRRIVVVNTDVNENLDDMIVPKGPCVLDGEETLLRRVLRELLHVYPYLPSPIEIQVRNCSMNILRVVSDEIEYLGTPEIRANLVISDTTLKLEYKHEFEMDVDNSRDEVSEYDNFIGRLNHIYM